MTETLKSICGQCTQLTAARIDFVPGSFARHRNAILRDLRELVLAASKNSERTVVLLSGCILESVLFSFLHSQETYIATRRGSFTFNPNHSLDNFVSIFNRWFRDVLPTVVLPDFVVDYRDLVHINRELNSPDDIFERASRDMLRILDRLLDELNQFAAPAATSANPHRNVWSHGKRLWRRLARLWNSIWINVSFSFSGLCRSPVLHESWACSPRRFRV
jgi:hypothetical protein